MERGVFMNQVVGEMEGAGFDMEMWVLKSKTFIDFTIQKEI